MKPAPFARTEAALLLLLILLSGVAFSCVAAMVTVERFMEVTPADWPYPGSLLDRANDLACLLILLPAGPMGRFCYWLVFFPVPILIELNRGSRQKAVFFALCVLLPYSSSDILFDNAFSREALPGILQLLLALAAPPFLIRSWIAPAMPAREKKLLCACLVLLWIVYCACDVMLGLNIHHAYCKVSLTNALTR